MKNNENPTTLVKTNKLPFNSRKLLNEPPSQFPCTINIESVQFERGCDTYASPIGLQTNLFVVSKVLLLLPQNNRCDTYQLNLHSGSSSAITAAANNYSGCDWISLATENGPSCGAGASSSQLFSPSGGVGVNDNLCHLQSPAIVRLSHPMITSLLLRL